jgi:hypothetical protein
MTGPFRPAEKTWKHRFDKKYTFSSRIGQIRAIMLWKTADAVPPLALSAAAGGATGIGSGRTMRPVFPTAKKKMKSLEVF